MRYLLAAILSMTSVYAQSPVFPGGVVTDSQLKVQVNGTRTSLTAPLTSGALSASVAGCSNIVANTLATIDTEIMAVSGCSGLTLTMSSRGFNGSTAASHALGAVVSLFITAWHHNALRVEVEAIEGASTSTNVSGNIVKRDSSGNFVASTITASLIGAASGNELPLTFGAGLSRSVNTITVPTNGIVDSMIATGITPSKVGNNVAQWNASQLNGILLSGLATGILKNTTGTGQPSAAAAADVVGLFSGCSGTLPLTADGACHAGGTGTITSIILAGTAGQIIVTGTCTVTTTGTCTFSLPSALVLPGTINGLTLTTSTGTVTVANGKTITVSKSLTLDGTDGVTVTFPASNATVATLGLTNTFTGRQDATGAASTAPAKSGTSLPGTCAVGDQFFLSNATAGQNNYDCTGVNTWSAVALSAFPNVGNTVACDGLTNVTAPLISQLGSPGGIVVLPKSPLPCLVSNLTVTANNVTLDCAGTQIKSILGSTGILLQANGVANFRMQNCDLHGNNVLGLTYLFEADNATNVQISKSIFENAGTAGSGHFQGGVLFFQSSGSISGSYIHDVAGYCLYVQGANSGWTGTGNHLSNCYKNGFLANGTTSSVAFTGNVIDHCYDYGADSTGAYGNCVYITGGNGSTISTNQIYLSEYSGVRIATSGHVSVTGNQFYQTGDWGIYASDFNGGGNMITGNAINDCFGGGINAANAGDNLAFGVNISGNQITNCHGSSTNAGGTTPAFGYGILGDGFVNIASNYVNGSFYGIGCWNGEGGVFVDVGCSVKSNQVSDTRQVTLVVAGTSGSVTGSQNGVASDKIYLTSSGSLGAATKIASVVSCIPISSGVTCNSPTSITVAPQIGFFAAAEGITDAGPTGNLTATVSTVTGPALYYLTLTAVAGFNLGDTVHTGTGATSATGTITCSTSVVATSGCAANHIMVVGTINGSGLLVPFGASGTITDDTTSASTTITARTTVVENMQAGIVANSGDTSPVCSIQISDNAIYGYQIADIDGITGGVLGALGSGTCISRDGRTPGKYSWGFCNGSNCTAADTILQPIIVTEAPVFSPTHCYVTAGTPPTGANLTGIIKVNGSTAATFTAVAGVSGTQNFSCNGMTAVTGANLTANLTAIGSGTPGEYVTVTISQ